MADLCARAAFVHVPSIVLINLVLGRKAVPEFIQGACTGEALAEAIIPLLSESDVRAAQLRDLKAAVKALGLGEEAPSMRAAHIVLDFAETHSGTNSPYVSSKTSLA